MLYQAWRKRACVLEGQTLRYYKGAEVGSPQGVVSLVGSTMVKAAVDVDRDPAALGTGLVEFSVRECVPALEWVMRSSVPQRSSVCTIGGNAFYTDRWRSR
jgi:hypothetical protein